MASMTEQEFLAFAKTLSKDIGDDCAVLPFTEKEHLLVSTDCLVENVHFQRARITPQQVGWKAVETNVSDIAAMGGQPTKILVSLIAPSLERQFIRELYKGIEERCRKYSITLCGGNISLGNTLSITITILGKVPVHAVRYRHGAQIGDALMISGPLGKSAASGWTHIPQARLDFSSAYAQYCSAMIDISDGLALDLHRLCQASGVGAVIQKEKISLAEGAQLSQALYGGEDYELLVTVPNKELVQGIVIGEIIPSGVYLEDGNGIRKPLPDKGFDHFMMPYQS